MTTTVRYLLAGGVTLLGVIILLILWRLAARASLRRIRRDLSDLNPRIRRTAVLALKERELAPVADRLVTLTTTERDADVLDAIAEVIAHTAWQPADSPAIVELRTRAGVIAAHGAPSPVQPVDAAPSVPVDEVRSTPAEVTTTDFGIRSTPLGDVPPDAASSAAALLSSVMDQVATATAEVARPETERSAPDLDDPWAILSEPFADAGHVRDQGDPPETTTTSEVFDDATAPDGAQAGSEVAPEAATPPATEANQIVLLVHTGKKAKKKQNKNNKTSSKPKKG